MCQSLSSLMACYSHGHRSREIHVRQRISATASFKIGVSGSTPGDNSKAMLQDKVGLVFLASSMLMCSSLMC